MKKIKKDLRFFTLMLILEIVLIVGAILFFAGRAEAHQINPAKCNIYWQQAPVGKKWPAKQQCLAYVEKHNCIVDPPTFPAGITVKGIRVDGGQRHVLRHIVVESQRRKLRRVIVDAAVAATTQEASARELNHGHGSSLGPFQLISSHGTAAQRRTVEYSFNWFANGAVKVVRRDPNISPAALAQAVERSAYPSAYRQWVPEARSTVATLTRGCTLLRN